MITRPLLFGGAVRIWRGLGFAVFCLLAGSRWLVESAFPRLLPPLLGQGFRFALIALAALAFWLLKRHRLPSGWCVVGLGGVLLFGVPALVIEWAGGQAEAAVFTLVPLCVVVCVAAISPEQNTRRLMMPALVGAAGGLLVLPFALPATFGGTVLLGVGLLAVASTAVGSVWLHQALRKSDFTAGVWLVCGANAIVLGVVGLSHEGAGDYRSGWLSELMRAMTQDLPEVLLLLWLLREMRPEQAAARTFLVPLVTVAEGLVLLRPAIDPRLGMGVALMMFGAVALLFWREDDKVAAPLSQGVASVPGGSSRL